MVDEHAEQPELGVREVDLFPVRVNDAAPRSKTSGPSWASRMNTSVSRGPCAAIDGRRSNAFSRAVSSFTATGLTR